MAWQVSVRGRTITSSAIREILKVTERPDVISFAGGLPAPQTFPLDRIRDACTDVLARAGTRALQYAPTEGLAPLREWIAERHSAPGCAIDPEQVLITTGSQQALDLIGKVLVEAGSVVLVETPTYLGALQALSLSLPRFVSVPCDDDGPLPEGLLAARAHDARFLYLIPNFQNPTGRYIPEARRVAILQAAAEADLTLVEDDPYSALAYDGSSAATFLSLGGDRVIRLGSFSKLLAPGLRIGYCIAPVDIRRRLVLAKQAADLHTPSFTQAVAFEVVKDGFLDRHVPTIRSLYAAQCAAMLAALERHFPPGAVWNRPRGGMFVWVTLPPSIDGAVLLERAIEEKVAFVPGAPFYAEQPQANTMRLSFVTVPPPLIDEGIARLGRLIRGMMD
jgi:2-aminoadipate transaminase